MQVAREAHTVIDAYYRRASRVFPRPPGSLDLPFGAGMATSWWSSTHLTTPELAMNLLDNARVFAIANHSRAIGEQAVHRVVLFGFTLMTLFFLFREGQRVAGQFLRASHRAFGPSGACTGGR